MSKTFTERSILELKCPCGGTCTVTEDAQGELASILHTMPMCSEFEVLDPDEYLRWVRGKIEGRFDA